MELFIVGLLLLFILAGPVVVLVLQLLARARLKKLEQAVGTLESRYARRLQQLEARLDELAGRAQGSAPESDAEGAATGWVPAGPEPVDAVSPDALAPPAAPAPARSSTAAALPTAARSSAAPPAADSSRQSSSWARSSAEWEQLIGGNLLNKIGAVVTVIGIALGLGYSMRYLGPAGRVAVALAASAAMLGAGALLEKRERYRIFARGLIGGGWAGVYFTTFAMHGLEAARIIDSPTLGTVLLMAVAVGMVLHSLLYRSQTVTGLAYLVTFATLAVVPVSRFALFASVPAAASLLYVARRYRWNAMMVAGVVFTYGAYLLRGGAPDVGPEDWVFGQLLLFVYWLLFELFDLTAYRTRRAGGIDETLMPLNAAGFIGASLLGWSAVRPDTLWAFFVLCAAMFTASAMLRELWAPTFAEDDEIERRRPRFDGSEVALTIASAMLVFGIEQRFDGWRESLAWLLQAQLLIYTGLTMRRPFLRHLGSAVLVLPVLVFIGTQIPPSGTFASLGITWFRGTPLALLLAGSLYADRVLIRRSASARVAGLEHAYSGVATFIVAVVMAYEVPDMWIAPAWFAFGLALVGLGLARRAGGLYVQGYVVVVFSWLLMTFANVPADMEVFGVPARWGTALPMIGLLYALAWVRRPVGGSRWFALQTTSSGRDAAPDEAGGIADTGAASSSRRPVDRLAEALDRTAAAVCFGVATFLGAWFLLFEVSGSWLTVAWGLQGVTLLIVGFALRARRVRMVALALLGVCIGKLFLYDVAELEILFRIFSFIILGALLLAVSFAYSRYREQIRKLL